MEVAQELVQSEALTKFKCPLLVEQESMMGTGVNTKWLNSHISL